MGVTYQSAGTAGTGSTAPAPSYPASVVAPDLVCLFTNNKPFTSKCAVPSGFTAAGDAVSGSVANANGSGSTRTRAFWREATGSLSGTLTLSIPSGNTSVAQMVRLTKGAGETWSVLGLSGGDTSETGTTVSATASALSLVDSTFTIGGTASFKDLGYGNGVWVAVGFDGANPVVYTSSDGVTWTARTSNFAAGSAVHAAVYGGGTWVITGSLGQVAVSTNDGATWTLVAPATTGFANNNDIYWVSYQNGVFVAGQGYTVRYAASPNGAWTASTYNPNPTAATLGIAWTGTHWVAPGTSNTTILYSTSLGGTWTSKTIFTSGATNMRVGFGDGRIVAMSVPGTRAAYIASTDPSGTWTEVTGLAVGNVSNWSRLVTDNAGTWVVTNSASGDYHRSTDGGATWAKFTTPLQAAMNGVAFDGTSWMVAGDYFHVAKGLLGVPDIKSGDVLLLCVGLQDDALTHSSQALSVPGCTLGTITWLTKVSTTTGNDNGMYIGYVSVTAGTCTELPSYTATSSVSGAGAASVVIHRVRAASSGTQFNQSVAVTSTITVVDVVQVGKKPTVTATTAVTDQVQVGVARAATAATTVARQVAAAKATITLTFTSTVTHTAQKVKLLAVSIATAATSVTSRRAAGKQVAATPTATVTDQVQVGAIRQATAATTVTARRTVATARQVASAATVAAVRAVTTGARQITATATATAKRAVGKAASTTSASSVTASRAVTFTRAVAATATVTATRVAGKAAAVAVNAAVTVARTVGKLAAATATAAVTVGKQVNQGSQTIQQAVTVAATGTVNVIRLVVRALQVTGTGSVTGQRQAVKPVLITPVSTTSSRRAVTFARTVVAPVTTTSRRVVATARQVVSTVTATAARQVGKSTQAAVASVIATTRQVTATTPKAVVVTVTSAVTVSRQIARGVAVSITSSATVASQRAVRTAIAVSVATAAATQRVVGKVAAAASTGTVTATRVVSATRAAGASVTVAAGKAVASTATVTVAAVLAAVKQARVATRVSSAVTVASNRVKQASAALVAGVMRAARGAAATLTRRDASRPTLADGSGAPPRIDPARPPAGGRVDPNHPGGPRIDPDHWEVP